MSAPETLDLRAAAGVVNDYVNDGDDHGLGAPALEVWCALVGLPHDEAVKFAQSIILSHSAVAAVVPF